MARRKGDTTLDEGDNNTVHIEMNTSFKFYGYEYQSLYISMDGFISFKEPPNRFFNISEISAYLPLVSACFGDITLEWDSRIKVMYRKIDLAKERQLSEMIFEDSKAIGEPLTAKLAFIVTWKSVNPRIAKNKVLPMCQLVLASDGDRTITISNYDAHVVADDKIHYLNGKGQHEYYVPRKGNSFLDDTTNVDIPGRIVLRADQAYVTLTDVKIIKCDLCLLYNIAGTGNIMPFDGSNTIFKFDASRKYLVSKIYQGNEISQRDKCNYKLKFIVDDKGNGDWVSFSVGVHPKNPRKYLRNFAFGRHEANQLVIRGHNEQKTITEFPHYETISVNGELVSVVVEKEGVGWYVRGTNCQYKVVFAQIMIQLILGPHYRGRTTGLCQNYNNDKLDDNKDCSQPPKRADTTAIIESCSCPIYDKACNKKLNTL